MNSRLLASEKASGAPTARITSIRQNGFGGGQGNKTNRRGSAFNKDGSVNLGSNAEMTYEEDVVNAINAITNKYNNKIQPIYKKLDAIPRNNNRYAPPSPAEIKLLNQIDSLIDAQTKEEQGVYDEWDDYNKQPNPDLNLPQDVPPDFPDAKSDAAAEAGYEKAKKGLSGFPSWSDLSSDLELPDIPEPGEPGWTYDEYMAMYNAL